MRGNDHSIGFCLYTLTVWKRGFRQNTFSKWSQCSIRQRHRVCAVEDTSSVSSPASSVGVFLSPGPLWYNPLKPRGTPRLRSRVTHPRLPSTSRIATAEQKTESSTKELLSAMAWNQELIVHVEVNWKVFPPFYLAIPQFTGINSLFGPNH